MRARGCFAKCIRKRTWIFAPQKGRAHFRGAAGKEGLRENAAAQSSQSLCASLTAG